MGVGHYTPNAAVNGDMGWDKHIMKQWSSVINGLLYMLVMKICCKCINIIHYLIVSYNSMMNGLMYCNIAV